MISKKCLTENIEKPETAKDINFTDIFSVKKIEKIMKNPARLFKKYSTVEMDDQVSTQNDGVLMNNKKETR